MPTNNTWLVDVEIQAVLDTVKTHFPHRTDGEYHNDVDDDDWGFTGWGAVKAIPDRDYQAVASASRPLGGGAKRILDGRS